MSARLQSLHHIGVIVEDLDATIAWYERHLGFAVLSTFGFPGARVAFIGRGAVKLELFQIDGAAPISDRRRRPDGAGAQGSAQQPTHRWN